MGRSSLRIVDLVTVAVGCSLLADTQSTGGHPGKIVARCRGRIQTLLAGHKACITVSDAFELTYTVQVGRSDVYECAEPSPRTLEQYCLGGLNGAFKEEGEG